MDGSLFVLLLLSGLFPSSSALSRQYHYINVRMSWPEAQSYCRERFTDLATVDSMDDVNRLVNIVDAGYSGSVWIGLKRGTQKRWENSGYILVRSAKIWSDAQSYCRQNYRDLPTINNSEQNNQINNIILSGWYIWIGLFLDSWEWSDKWSLFFRHWAAGQPSQSSGSDDCVGMSRTDSGKWAQYSCDLQQPFICYGDDKFIKKQIIRLKLSCYGKCTLNDLSLQTAMLNEMSEKLKIMGLESESKINWRKREGEEVFHLERNHTINEKLKNMGLETMQLMENKPAAF
ncbi:uncharacterized protein LOC113040228 [Carassius auratus]|uniref:Uncharacterized protein LOC113040228 n=1 Tax=Carassius auratus TaxID=7957 RepID=A0A6P6J2I5_CARAU|nr:uncharacterized protein LOC113040228 [Carassius auratus]